MAILPTGLEGMSLMREVTPNKLTAILEDVSRCCCLLFCLNSIFQIKAYDDLKKLVGSDGRKRFFQLAMFSALCKWTPVNHQTSNTNLQCVCVCVSALFGLMGKSTEQIKPSSLSVDGHLLIHPLHLNDLNSFFWLQKIGVTVSLRVFCWGFNVAFTKEGSDKEGASVGIYWEK